MIEYYRLVAEIIGHAFVIGSCFCDRVYYPHAVAYGSRYARYFCRPSNT